VAKRFVVPLAGSVAIVAAATLLVWALTPIAPRVSLGVVYVVAVLPVAVLWGLRWSLPVSVASMLAFNFFFLPPIHTFTLSDSANWFALAAYSTTAVVVSELAARARRRAADAEQREREASLLAEVAEHLLAGGTVSEQLGWIESRAAEAFGVDTVRIDLKSRTVTPAGRSDALAALLAVALDRERLEREAVEAETLRRSDLVKTAILRAVSHDLRSPLTGITTAVGALRNESLVFSEDDRRELLETIAVDAARLNRLVADLLDLSRLEAGAAEPEAEVLALDELVHELVADLPDGRRVQVSGEAPLVSVDPVHVRRVLVNLLENALKFSPPSSRVHVRFTATRKEAIVRVVDSGPGIPARELDRVFEPFYRGASSVGAGLGLAIARGFAAANGGRVWAESRPGQGTTFALALPVVRVPTEVVA